MDIISYKYEVTISLLTLHLFIFFGLFDEVCSIPS